MNAIRPGHARESVVSFLLLAAVLAACTLLETARDAVFLSHLPISKLPWAFILTAVGVVLAVAAKRKVAPQPSRRRSASTLALASVTLFVWQSCAPRSAPSHYVLYAGINVICTLVLVDAWTFIGTLFNFADARRAFSFVAAGGTLGAIGASVLATRALVTSGPRTLVSIAALLFAIAAALPLLLPPLEADRQDAHAAVAPPAQHEVSYAARIFWMVSLATVAITCADLLFKQAVVARIPAARLGMFFAHFQLATHLCSLTTQLVIAPYILRRLSANRLVMALPAVFVGVGAGLVLLPGLALSVVLRLIDGAMRNSIYRTSTELLYQPLPLGVRGRVKALIDGVGQRLAQAVAALLLLGVLALHGLPTHVALLMTMSAGASLIVAYSLRLPYIQVIRARLSLPDGSESRAPHSIDANTVHKLLSLLGSSDEDEVLAAMETLSAEQCVALLPSLLVYHASPKVTLRALELFEGRSDLLSLTEALLGHASVAVRTAAARARAKALPTLASLRALAHHERPELRAAGLVGIFARGAGRTRELRALRHLMTDRAGDTRRAVLEAITVMPHPALVPFAAQPVEDPALQLEAARALQACGDKQYLFVALSLLQFRRLREEVRRLLVEGGTISQEFLGRALADPATPVEVRRHIPRALSRFRTQRAATILFDHLSRNDGDGVTLFKTLRGLGRMRSKDPSLRLDRFAIEKLARLTMHRIATLRAWSSALASALVRSSLQLLKGLLDRKVHLAEERLFRYLDLLDPRQDMERIYRGLSNADAEIRAASRELLEQVADHALVRDVLLLVDGTERSSIGDDSSRRQRALRAMALDRSAAIRALVAECEGPDQAQVRLAS